MKCNIRIEYKPWDLMRDGFLVFLLSLIYFDSVHRCEKYPGEFDTILSETPGWSYFEYNTSLSFDAESIQFNSPDKWIPLMTPPAFLFFLLNTILFFLLLRKTRDS